MKMHVLRDFRQAVIRSIRTKAIKAMPAFKPGGAGGNCGTGAGGFKPGNVCAAGGLGSMAKHPGVQSAQQGEFAKALVTSASVWNTGTVAAQAKAKAEVMAEASGIAGANFARQIRRRERRGAALCAGVCRKVAIGHIKSRA